MEWNRKKIKQVRNLILFTALVILALMYSSSLLRAFVLFLEMLEPFVFGGMIAFILNIPMKLMEEKLLVRWKGKAAEKLKRPVSMMLSLAVVVLAVTVFVMTVVPQLIRTVNDLADKIPQFLEQSIQGLQKMGEEYPEINQYLESMEKQELSLEKLVGQIMDFMKNGGSKLISTTIGVASGVISSLVNGIIAFIFAFYVLASKEKLGDQGKRILHAFASPRIEEKTLYIFSLLYKNFSSFFTGQCLEAVILGTIFVVVMSVLRMPYAVMIGVMIAFTALIPIVGAFIGCIVGAFFILVNSPSMALGFVVLFLVIQQIEGNLIYPKVVGQSVGLPPIWVLVAVSVGGSLFGVIGMLVFIPLVSTGYILLKEMVDQRNQAKAEKGNAERPLKTQQQLQEGEKEVHHE